MDNIIELTLNGRTKQFVLSQEGVTKNEIIKVYKEYSNNNSKLDIYDFVNALEQYGIYLSECYTIDIDLDEI